MMRARIIYNPVSGKAQFEKLLPEVLKKLEAHGYETSCHATSSHEDAIRAAKLASKRGFEIVVAVGGDGTINAVVHGISQSPIPPKLGIIPAGTTNDFARAMGIGEDMLDAVDIILRNRVHRVDVGRVGNKFFINIAAGGVLTEVSYTAPTKLKAVVGELAYIIKGLEKLPTFQPVYAEIQYDEHVFSGEIMVSLISNTNSVGGFERFAPIASAHDGKFDLIIVKKGSIPELVDVARKIVTGKHLEHPLIHYVHAKRIKVNAPMGMPINLDGEYGGTVPAEFANLHHHLEIFLPGSE